MQRQLAAISTESAPFRSLVMSIDSTSTKPSIYAGATSTTRAALTGDKGRYTQADPLTVDAFTPPRERARTARAVYEYANGNPERFVDPFGLISCPGRCGADCESGAWVGVGENAGGGILFGKFKSRTVLFCTSSRKYCHFESTCTTVGLQAGASAGVSFYGYRGCYCTSQIVATDSLSLGPITLDAAGSCMGLSYAVDAASAGKQTVVGATCSTRLLGCMY